MLKTDQKSNYTLKDLRVNAGLTQYELALILDLRGNTISEWERGLTEPRIPIRKVLLLCQTLDCSLDDLILALDETKNTSQLGQTPVAS
jgi:transcriptional regulator with XRE-family HTH domain